ncbi:MAG TPA: hypothetical protein VE596_04820 [Gaiellaceae bacterium]|jgi:hypothetical protein|nr:hypothetical protein [Gaiellaceae bacterium]
MGQIVECLRCRKQRDYRDDECPRCGYLGWAASRDLDEPIRGSLRERPPEARKLRPIA